MQILGMSVMARRLIIVATLILAIMAVASGVRAGTQRRACLSYEFKVWGWVMETPRACRPCVMLPQSVDPSLRAWWDTTTCPQPR